jgi:hypothetical protein
MVVTTHDGKDAYSAMVTCAGHGTTEQEAIDDLIAKLNDYLLQRSRDPSGSEGDGDPDLE